MMIDKLENAHSNRESRVPYTEYAGLEITAETAVALRTRKSAMLVQNCIGAYGGKVVSQPLLIDGTSR